MDKQKGPDNKHHSMVTYFEVVQKYKVFKVFLPTTFISYNHQNMAMCQHHIGTYATILVSLNS